MTSQDRRYQDSRYQQDEEGASVGAMSAMTTAAAIKAPKGISARLPLARAEATKTQREGRWRDEYRQNEFPGDRSGGYVNRGRFEEGYFGDRREQWDRDPGGRERYQNGDRSHERELYRPYGSSARGQRGPEQDEQWAPRGAFGRPQSSPWSRASWNRSGDDIPSWAADEEVAYRFRQDRGRYQGRDHQGFDERARYQGIGPKNYKRSDDRIREDVSDRLTDEPYVNAAEIEVSAVNSEVTLNGSAENREQRRLAELIAEQVSGVSHVQNNLRVKGEHQGAAQGTGQGASSQPAVGLAKAGSHA
jgi:hypothetical protein